MNILKKTLKRLAVAALILGVCAGAFCACVNIYVVDFARDYILSASEAASLGDFDCILVLGCGIREDGTPSRMLRDRLAAGVELYKAGAAPKLLMSGDHGSADYNEVAVMKAYAVEAGIPDEDVFMDHAGFSTYDSMYRARDVFLAGRVLIVTQDYHLSRAVYDARALGLDAYGTAAKEVRYGGQTMRDLRELAARCKDWAFVVFSADPVVLGDVIPVFGDGNLTND